MTHIRGFVFLIREFPSVVGVQIPEIERVVRRAYWHFNNSKQKSPWYETVVPPVAAHAARNYFAGGLDCWSASFTVSNLFGFRSTGNWCT